MEEMPACLYPRALTCRNFAGRNEIELNKPAGRPFLTGNLIIMFKRFFISTSMLLSAIFLFAEKTTIKGYLPGGNGNEIRLIAYSDMITHTETILDRTVIDSTDSFYFITDLKETIVAFLDLDYYTATLYLEPGENYSLQFDPVNMTGQYRPFYNKDQLVFRVISENSQELNALIFTFNESYNDFLITNFEDIYKRRRKGLIDQFRLEMETKYAVVDNRYFQDYITFKIASAELSAVSVNKAELFNKYLDGKKVFYQHDVYMDFFNQFFDRHLTSGNKFITVKDLEKMVNDRSGFVSLMEILGKDTLLRSERIRELVLMKYLKEIYYSPEYDGQNVLNVLVQVVSESQFQEHRLIAGNLIKSLTKLQKGTQAPDFRLPNLEGDTLTLSTFYGKPVYLSFLTTWTYACLAEFEILDSLYNKYGSEINFITISLDDNISVVKRYSKEKEVKWIMLYNGTQYDLIRDYGIKTFPLFVLISNEGMILQYPANKPSEGIEEAFNRLLKTD
jgi:peroxiredoxin